MPSQVIVEIGVALQTTQVKLSYLELQPSPGMAGEMGTFSFLNTK